MSGSRNIVIIGLSLSSSWGNGHATTFRSLIGGLAVQGHKVCFLEKDVPWYASQRDLEDPDFCELFYYQNNADLLATHAARIRAADAVIIGSYVNDGVQLIDELAALDPRRLSFYDIDTPVTLAKLDRGDEEYLARRQMPVFDTYFSFSGGEVLRQLEQQYGVRDARALYCSVDTNIYRNTGEACRWDLGYLGTYSPDRQPTLERLLIEPARRLPQMRFVVAGPQYPADIDWPDNVERIDHLPPAQHASFYSRQRFTLNVTRADMIAAGWSPSVRLFEAAACATPVISDDWRGLQDLLPDREAILIAQDTGDVVGILENLSAGERGRIGEAARHRIVNDHNGVARANELLAALESSPAVTSQAADNKQTMVA